MQAAPKLLDEAETNVLKVKVLSDLWMVNSLINTINANRRANQLALAATSTVQRRLCYYEARLNRAKSRVDALAENFLKRCRIPSGY